MPLICDEMLLLAEVSLDAEFRYVVLPISDPMPDVVVVAVSGSVLVLLTLLLLMALRRLDDLAGTGGGPMLVVVAAVVVAVSVTIRRSVTVVMVIVSTTYLWLLGLLDDDRIFLLGFLILFDAPSSKMRMCVAYRSIHHKHIYFNRRAIMGISIYD